MDRDMHLPQTTTIAAAHQTLIGKLDKGVICPVCTQFAKRYARPIRAGMVLGLGVLYAYDNNHPAEWCHVEKEFKRVRPEVRGGDWCKLRFWGMIEPAPKHEDDALDMETSDSENPRSGLWRITPRGRDFIDGSIRVQERALVFNNKCYGFSGQMMNVLQIMQAGGFQYGDIMP